jgi:hypothetical protein
VPGSSPILPGDTTLVNAALERDRPFDPKSHNRQDSMQESIFQSAHIVGSNSKLFDASKLPKQTAPGDLKQRLQKCLLYAIVTFAGIGPDPERAPLSVDIAEFNSEPVDSEQFIYINDAYWATLLDALSAFVQLEAVIKQGLASFTNQNTPHGQFIEDTLNQLMYAQTSYRGGTIGRDAGQNKQGQQQIGTLELRMFTLTVLHSLK